MQTCSRCQRRPAAHKIGLHQDGHHEGEVYLCVPCFDWALQSGYIEEPFIDPAEYIRRTQGGMPDA